MNAKQTGKKAGQVVLRLVWPGAAIKQTIEYTKKAQEQHKNNIVHIKGLYQEVRKSAKFEPQEEAQKDLSFEEAMNNRAPGSPSIPLLYDLFLLKKRLALAVGAVFITTAIYALANGTWLGLATLLASPPVFFLIALSAQLRLWQLRTRRLSQAEKGGLQDFLTEIRGWWWVVLDPELSRKKGAQP
ncbi:hypothetical protein [Pseudomonas sp.]|uniref:hypothetical protein n=1 Tax=Pseudomonas sp. TaxID=306 RepID=UPI0039823603